ncbi:myosin-binding protein 1-like [Oryza brachyantha]|uniref:GTD-binding domain-containing protein n=1 Tax=Oryza brachyantha TaxID=4533 RepID=J3L4K8_ORYBR|nr:myosin-binding protein 1-like [Oryza brachyantha]
MGTRMPTLRRLSATLSSVLLEWILMMMLFIDAVYCFFVTRFARLCRLPAPCPFCSRLDHILGNEEPCFYRELICKTHKSEISSLAFCRLHQKLAGARSMCERCSDSLAETQESNTDDRSDEPMMDSNQGNSAVLHHDVKRICSCCAQHYTQQRPAMFTRAITELEPAEAVFSPKICTDDSILHQVDKSLDPKDVYHQSDHSTHERDSVLQMTSGSEDEAPYANDGKISHHHETNCMEEDSQEDATAERLVVSSTLLVKSSEMNVLMEPNVADSHDMSSPYVLVDDPDSITGGGQIDAKDVSLGRQTCQHDTLPVVKESGLTDADVPEFPVASSVESPRNLGYTEAYHGASESAIEPYSSESTTLEQHSAVSEHNSTEDDLEGHRPENTVTSSTEFHQRSALIDDDSVNFQDDYVSQVNSSYEVVDEAEDYAKKTEKSCNIITHEPTLEDPPNTATKDLIEKGFLEEAPIAPHAIRPSSEVSQGLNVIEEHPKTSATIGERRPSLSTQISMNEAYKIAIGAKSSLPSPTLTDVILGKDTSSSVNEELRLLLSQLSASRGLEAPWIDPGPSPRAYGRGDDLIVQNITNRISIERNASGLESLEGSIVSEMEGESAIERLRRQIDLDRKSIQLLCKELEEERNASAIAANQALAMITRLQDEKAAMQMEALHYQRMMEEQAEYDSDALAKANELLAQREQQIEELEAELDNYRIQSNQVSFKEGNTAETLLDESDLEVPVITMPSGINSLLSFEDERAYIANCLMKLEQKLHSYSNNSASIHLSNSDVIEDYLSNKMQVADDDTLQCQESSREKYEPIFLAKEAESSAASMETDLSTLQEEILNLNKRLKTLEGDCNFIEHSINSLRNGKEGVIFIQEIANNLRELRATAVHSK